MTRCACSIQGSGVWGLVPGVWEKNQTRGPVFASAYVETSADRKATAGRHGDAEKRAAIPDIALPGAIIQWAWPTGFKALISPRSHGRRFRTLTPRESQLTATSTSFGAGSVFTGETWNISALDDISLAFSTYDFWSCPNNNLTVFNAGSNWVRWDSTLGINHYFSLNAYNTPPHTYFLREKNGIVHEGLSDYINLGGFPSYAHTLLTDGSGKAVASRVEGTGWKSIFLALPYEGLSPAGDCQQFLEKSLDWLLMEAPAGTP